MGPASRAVAGAPRVMARNLENGRVVAASVTVAATRIERAVGLMGRSDLQPGKALWIAPSRGVHTCWMRFPIELVALDRTGTVVDRVVGMKPWRLRPVRCVVGVLELPEGSLDHSDTQLGHRLTFELNGAEGGNTPMEGESCQS